MFSLKYFTLSVFFWLLSLSNFSFSHCYNTVKNQKQTVTTNKKSHGHLILKVSNYQEITINGSLKVLELLKLKEHIRVVNNYYRKLQNLDIGYFIPLKFTKHKIIYPFHFFT